MPAFMMYLNLLEKTSIMTRFHAILKLTPPHGPGPAVAMPPPPAAITSGAAKYNKLFLLKFDNRSVTKHLRGLTRGGNPTRA